MATASNSKRISEYRGNIRQYQPGTAASFQDGQIEFSEKLLVGCFGETSDVKILTEYLEAALNQDGRHSASRHTGSSDRESLTPYITLVKRGPLSGQTVSAGDVGCVVIVTNETALSNTSSKISAEIDTVRKDKGRPPIIVVLVSNTGNEERKKRLEQQGAIDIFQLPRSGSGNLSETIQLGLLELLERCMTDGDEVTIIRQLEMHNPCLAYSEKLRQMIDRGKKEATILAQQQIKHVEDQKNECNKKLENSEKDVKSLQNNNKSLQNKVMRSEEELTKTRETKITLARKLDQFQNNNSQLQRDLQEETNALQSTTHKVQELETALSYSQQQVKIFQNNNESLQKEVKHGKEELTRTRETKITLDRKLDQLQTNNAQLQRDLQKEKTSLQRTTQRVQQLETDLSYSKEQVKIFQNNNDSLQKEVKLGKEELTKTRETKITLDRKLDQLQTNNSQLQRDLQKEKKSLQTTTKKVQQLETDKVRLQKELNDSTIEGKNKADALTSRTHENENLEKQVKTLTESNEAFKSKIVKLEKEWNQKHGRLVDEASKNKRLLEADKAQLKGALESLNKAYQENVESLNKSANDIANLRENLDGKENELQTVVNNLSSTLENLEAEKSTRLEKQRRIDSLCADINQLELELEQHRQSSKDLKTTNAELRKTIKNVESAKSQLESKLESMQKEISELKLLTEETDKKNTFLEEDKTLMSEEFEKLKIIESEQVTTIDKMQNENTKLKDAIDKSTTNEKTLIDERARLEEDLKESYEQSRGLNDQISNLQKNVTRLEGELAENKESSSQTMANFKCQEAELEKERKEKLNLADEGKIYKQKLEDVKKTLKEKSKELEKSMEEDQSENKLQETIKDLNSQVDDLKKQLLESDQHYKRLKPTFQQLGDENQILIQRLQQIEKSKSGWFTFMTQKKTTDQLDEDKFPINDEHGTNESSRNISPLQEKDAKFDRALREISEELSAEHDIENLGRQLDIKQAVMERAIMNNSRFTEITFQGTLTMLRNWRKKIRSIADARRTLTKALEDANLANLIDKYLDEENENQGMCADVSEVPGVPEQTRGGEESGIPLEQGKGEKEIGSEPPDSSSQEDKAERKTDEDGLGSEIHTTGDEPSEHTEKGTAVLPLLGNIISHILSPELALPRVW